MNSDLAPLSPIHKRPTPELICLSIGLTTWLCLCVGVFVYLYVDLFVWMCLGVGVFVFVCI